jgi:hypothetical protein
MEPHQVSVRSLRRMSMLFALADALFLMVVGLASNSAMHLIHALEWNLVLTLVLGMAAAMAVQMVLAILAAPVLGSIETMVPSMIVGMLSPMQLCAVELIGYHPAPATGVFAGAAFGLVTFVALRSCGRSHSRFLRRTFSEM